MSSTAGMALSGAASGAAVGAAFGPWGAVIGAGVGAVAGALASLLSDGQYDKALELKQAAAQAWNIPLPQFENFVAKNIQQDFSSPVARQAQLQALAQLQNISNHGGMDAQSQAATMNAEAAAGQQLRSSNAAIMANRAARGISGSGDELAAQLAGSQASNQNYALQSANAAAAARQRALQAMSMAGQQAGALRSADMNQSEAEAALRKFNENMRLSATNIYNQNQQNTFNDAAHRAGGYADALNGVANEYDKSGDRAQNATAAGFQAATKFGTAYGAGQYGQGGPDEVNPNVPDYEPVDTTGQRPIGTGVGYNGGSW